MAAALGIEPYFDEPFYVGFDVGGGVWLVVVREPSGRLVGIIVNPHFAAHS